MESLLGAKGNGPGPEPQEQEWACLAIAMGDWAGAYLMLRPWKESGGASVLFQLALCLRQAGEREEAVEILEQATSQLQAKASAKREPAPLGTQGNTVKKLMEDESGDTPLLPSLAERFPEYALFRVKRLQALALWELGEKDRALRIWDQLSAKYGISLGPAAEKSLKTGNIPIEKGKLEKEGKGE